MSETLKFGNGQWATKVGSTLAYNDENGNFKPLPFNFTRSTGATRVNKDGLIEVVTNNKPRIDFLNNSNGALLLEPSATAINNFSEELDNAYWIGSAVVTANTDISPNGSQNADTLNDNTTGFLDKRGVITVTPNVAHTFSFFVKKTYGELTHYAGMAALLTGVATRVDYGIINTTTGVINRDASSNINSVSYSSVSYGDYWRVIMTFTDNQSNTTCTIITYPAISINGTSLNQNAQGSNVFWGINFTQSTNATSYIPTQGATATRVAETCSQTPPSGIIGQTEGTIFVDYQHNPSEKNQRIFRITRTGGGFQNSISLEFNSPNNLTIFNFNAGVGNVAITSVRSINERLKIAIKYKENDFAMYINGQLIGTDNTCTIAGLFSELYLFSLSTGQINSYANYFSYWKTALTNQELINLTTI